MSELVREPPSDDHPAAVQPSECDSPPAVSGHRSTPDLPGIQLFFDTRDFVETVRLLEVTPHVAQNTTNQASAIDARTTRHVGYVVSQWKRKRVEEIFGWLKSVFDTRFADVLSPGDSWPCWCG